MTELTVRQREVLDFCVARFERIGAFGMASMKGAYDHLRALEKKGHVRFDHPIRKGSGQGSRVGSRSRSVAILSLSDGTEVVPRLVPRALAERPVRFRRSA